MPLSEHEQRMLDQIEQALYAEDPKFANTVRHTNPQIHYKRGIIKASLGFIIGVCLLMSGVIFQDAWPIGALGFIVMLACTLWGLSAWRRVVGGGATESSAPAQPKQKRQQRSNGMMNRFEERWRRRQEGDN